MGRSGSGEHLGKILIDAEVISEEQLEDALRRQEERDMPVGSILVELGY